MSILGFITFILFDSFVSARCLNQSLNVLSKKQNNLARTTLNIAAPKDNSICIKFKSKNLKIKNPRFKILQNSKGNLEGLRFSSDSIEILGQRMGMRLFSQLGSTILKKINSKNLTKTIPAKILAKSSRGKQYFYMSKEKLVKIIPLEGFTIEKGGRIKILYISKRTQKGSVTRIREPSIVISIKKNFKTGRFQLYQSVTIIEDRHGDPTDYSDIPLSCISLIYNAPGGFKSIRKSPINFTFEVKTYTGRKMTPINMEMKNKIRRNVGQKKNWPINKKTSPQKKEVLLATKEITSKDKVISPEKEKTLSPIKKIIPKKQVIPSQREEILPWAKEATQKSKAVPLEKEEILPWIKENRPKDKIIQSPNNQDSFYNSGF